MRGTIAATLVLALGACSGEHTGWNPNYSLGDRPYDDALDRDTSYARYLTHREAALQGKVEPSRTIPIARPFKAPTPEDIAGPSFWQIMQGGTRTATTTPAPQAGVVRTAPVAGQGPYPGSIPVLAQYAATVDHAPGTTVWPRRRSDPVKALQICTSYATADAAQLGYLSRGGPVNDPQGMDPDGDGFVCGWDPATWRPRIR